MSAAVALGPNSRVSGSDLIGLPGRFVSTDIHNVDGKPTSRAHLQSGRLGRHDDRIRKKLKTARMFRSKPRAYTTRSSCDVSSLR